MTGDISFSYPILIRAICCDEEIRAAIPLRSSFHDDFRDHIKTMGFVDSLSEKLLNIVELVKQIDREWEYSQREQKVCYKSFNKSVGSLVFNRRMLITP